MINRVVIAGRLTKDPELRKTNNGTAVTSFTVAVDNRMKDQEGNRTTSFIPCTVWGNSADAVAKIGRKGMLVGVDGRLNQRNYDRKDGTKATVLEVIADSVQFLEPKSATQARDGGESTDTEIAQPEPTSDGKNLDAVDVAEDDLPF